MRAQTCAPRRQQQPGGGWLPSLGGTAAFAPLLALLPARSPQRCMPPPRGNGAHPGAGASRAAPRLGYALRWRAIRGVLGCCSAPAGQRSRLPGDAASLSSFHQPSRPRPSARAARRGVRRSGWVHHQSCACAADAWPVGVCYAPAPSLCCGAVAPPSRVPSHWRSVGGSSTTRVCRRFLVGTALPASCSVAAWRRRLARCAAPLALRQRSREQGCRESCERLSARASGDAASCERRRCTALRAWSVGLPQPQRPEAGMRNAACWLARPGRPMVPYQESQQSKLAFWASPCVARKRYH